MGRENATTMDELIQRLVSLVEEAFAHGDANRLLGDTPSEILAEPIVDVLRAKTAESNTSAMVKVREVPGDGVPL